MKIRDEWNLISDEFNMFDSLDKDEVEDFADKLIGELRSRVAELENRVEFLKTHVDVLKVWWDVPGDDKNLSGAEKIIVAHGRIAELEQIVEIITEEHNAQAICAEDFAKTNAENGLFRHQIKELEKREKSQAAKIGRCEIEIEELETEIFEKDKCLSELEQQVDKMECCGNCSGNKSTITNDTCGDSLSEKYGGIIPSGGWCECWQPRDASDASDAAKEGGE